MRVLITGGSGFLGLHLAHYFKKRGHEIVLLDIRNFEKKQYPKGVTYINGDVRDPIIVTKAMSGTDWVIHAAAALPLWDEEQIFDINVNGTKTVLDIANKTKVRRFIFISSTAVYGVPKVHPVEEFFPLQGVGPYGESKIISEKIVESYRDRLIAGIVRPKTFIGPFRLGVFEILFKWVSEGRHIPVIGNGRNHYQLLDVEDLCSAIELILTASENKASQTYNVGAKEFATVFEDINALCAHANTGAKVLKTPVKPTILALRLLESLKLSPLYSWVYDTAWRDSYVSIEKISNELGWLPIYSNQQSLIRTYDWYIANKPNINQKGVSHRVAWDEKALGLLRKIL